jgi:hypothetical protein
MRYKHAVLLSALCAIVFMIAGQLGAASQSQPWFIGQGPVDGSYWSGEAYNWLNGGTYMPYGYDSLSIPRGSGAIYQNKLGPLDGSYWSGEAYNWLNGDAYMPYGYDSLSIPRGPGAIYQSLN